MNEERSVRSFFVSDAVLLRRFHNIGVENMGKMR